MSKSIAKLALLISFICLLSFSFANHLFAADPGLNVINNPNSQFYVPEQNTFNWILYTPGSPQELSSWKPTASNVVIRIHSNWVTGGLQMLGNPSEQQQIANQWCQSINSLSASNIYIEPFNELEQDYERVSTTGQLDLNTAITRAQIFISQLKGCLSKGTVTSPALDPQSANFPVTSQAFSNSSVISCHPYRLDTVDRCIAAANGKPLIFTEIGVDKNGVKYDDCEFITFFCDEKFISKVQSTPNLIAYFLFTFAPGNYSGSWELNSQSVVSALKNQCSGNLTCTKDTDATIDKIIASLKSNQSPGQAAPLPARGISAGPTYYSDGKGIIGFLKNLFPNWLDKLLGKEGYRYPINYRAKGDQYVEDVFPQSGQMDTKMTKLIQPPRQVTDQIATISQGSNSKKLLVNQANDINSTTSKEYADTINGLGPGYMFSTDGDKYDFYTSEGKKSSQRDLYDLKSGVSPRITSNSQLSDVEVDKVLCKLAASADPSSPYFISDPSQRLFDEALGYMVPVTERSFTLLTLGGDRSTYALADRTKSELSDTPVPIKISTIFCINKNLSTFMTKCAGMGFGAISTDVCSATPDWLKQDSIEGPVFRTFYPLVRQQIVVLGQNASAKGFVERCQEQDPTACQPSDPNTIVASADFDSLSVSTRTYVLDKNNGTFFKISAATCYACKVDMFFLTNLTKANQTANYAKQVTTSYKYSQTGNNTPSVINYSSSDLSDSGVYNPDTSTPLGVDNRQENYSYHNFVGIFIDKVRSFFGRIIKYDPCQISYSTDDQGQSIPTSTCQAEKKSTITTIIYIPSTAFEYVNNMTTYANNMIPYQTQNKLNNSIKKATNGKDNLVTKLDIGYQSGNGGSGLESGEQMYKSQKDTSSQQSFDEEVKQVGIAPNTTVRTKVANLYLLPYSWQDQMFINDNQAQYDQHRTSSSSLPSSGSFNSSVLNYCQYIKTAATASGLEPSLISAVISVESSGNPNAISHQGAVGLMQVMPSDAKDKDGKRIYFDCGGHDCFINRPTTQQLLDPQFNIDYGTKLLAGIIKYWGSVREGLKHYGPTNYEYKYADLVLSIQSSNSSACSP